jgi:PD-(D/E)XK nuclease family transposase
VLDRRNRYRHGILITNMEMMEGIMKKRLDLRVDFAFKSLFGTHGNESILAAFLNAALRFPDDKKFRRCSY